MGASAMTFQRDREGGFTLIEVLVAFAILAIGFLILLGPMTGGLSRNAGDRDHEQAVLLAQAKLAELGNQTPWFVGVRQGDVDGRLSWRLDVKPSGDRRGARGSDPVWRLLDVTVEISWPGAFGRRSFALATSRIVANADLGS
jgi:general secretion pathway protein I